ncbi:hypothetical protein HK105_203917 [Polyrhizophydium stewartii]|uniref:AB hydrolase-1 domain-containing protein n=1 Tax=Polyrhizophydium stewartii TaxID=2732419 RepID=A0ABR4NAI8_9FUNG|nr:hypothetical protein HK105_007248 [Polyrhizophydium stewartii]
MPPTPTPPQPPTPPPPGDAALAAAFAFADANARRTHHRTNVLALPNAASPLCIVFLHGLWGQLRELAPLIQHAAQAHSVLAFDSVGHGRSAASVDPADYTTDVIVKDTADFVEQFAPPHASRFVLVGHSYGCTIAARLALEWARRDAVAGIFLIAPKSELASHEAVLIDRLAPFVPSATVDAASWVDSKLGSVSVISLAALSRNATPMLRAEQTAMFNVMSGIAKKNTLLGARFAGKDVYEQLRLPIMLVGGTLDTIAPVVPNITNIEKWVAVPATRVHLLISGHQVMLEQHAKVNDLLDAFIADITP